MASLKGLGLACLATFSLCTPPRVFAQDKAPDWLRRPDTQDLMAVWPVAAMKSGRGGKAVVSCTVTVQGTLRDCYVKSEKPAGIGFGNAGLTLTSQFVMKPAIHDGKPVESTVSIPIDWPDMRAGSTSRLGNRAAEGIITRVIANVRWLRAPSVGDVFAAYPEKARAAKVGGQATLDCVVTKTGAVVSCDILQEAPAGYGFGGAARRLSTKFLGPTTDSAGASLAGAHTQILVAFSPDMLAGAPPVIGIPRWTGLPRAEDLVAAYPNEAVKAGVLRARVVLTCTVGTDGVLSDCSVESEDPVGYGFGKATVGLARTFKLGVWTAEGLPTVGGLVRVPIRYDMTERTKAAKP